MTRTELVFILWLLPWATLGVLCILGLCPLRWVYAYGLASLIIGVPMALSPRLRQLLFLALWRLGFKQGVTPRTREQHLRDHVPRLFKQAGQLLYIGAFPGRDELIDGLWRAGHEITLLEIWPRNAAHFAGDPRFGHVVCGDARDIPGNLLHESYEAVIWWHGPEHVSRDDALRTLAELEKLASLVILGMPRGVKAGKIIDGNVHNLHLSAWYEEDLAALGYQTATMGDRDVTHNHLLAWKRRV